MVIRVAGAFMGLVPLPDIRIVYAVFANFVLNQHTERYTQAPPVCAQCTPAAADE